MSVEAYPLQWPHGRPRKMPNQRRDGRFAHRGKPVTIAEAVGRLQDEAARIGARYVVISSNLVTRQDGLPRGNQAEPVDPGIALYFQLAGKPHCMPCDTYTKVAQNIAAIAAHIEATRAIERHGVSSVAEMFQGFTALPPPGAARSWRHVLDITAARPSPTEIEAHYRTKAKHAHPDAPGGSHDKMTELNAARDAALKEIGQ